MQGKAIHPSQDSHILDSDNILAIQSLQIGHSGNYSCTARNELGSVASEGIKIDVKCNLSLIVGSANCKIATLADPPKCLPGQQEEYETSMSVPLSVFCSVSANPGNNITFYWLFNTSEVEYEQKVNPHSCRRRRLSYCKCSAKFSVYIKPRNNIIFFSRESLTMGHPTPMK